MTISISLSGELGPTPPPIHVHVAHRRLMHRSIPPTFSSRQPNPFHLPTSGSSSNIPNPFYLIHFSSRQTLPLQSTNPYVTNPFHILHFWLSSIVTNPINLSNPIMKPYQTSIPSIQPGSSSTTTNPFNLINLSNSYFIGKRAKSTPPCENIQLADFSTFIFIIL